MLEPILNRLTRNLSEENKARFKRNFYNNLFIRGSSNGLLTRTVATCSVLVVIGSFLIRGFKQPNLWWFLFPAFILFLLVVHIIVTLKWTVFQTSYMWKNEVLIPKKYNRIALLVALVLFALTIYLLIVTFQREYPN